MDNIDELYKYVVAPGVLAIIAGIRGVWKYYAAKTPSDKAIAKKLEEVAKDTSEIFHVLRNLLQHLNKANRALVLKLHNGGGDLSPVTPRYLTALYEVALTSTRPMVDDISSTPLDSVHNDLVIMPLMLKGEAIVFKETGPKEMQDLYEAYNHSWSKVALLRLKKKSLIYLVISFEEGASRELTPLQNTKYHVAVTRITNILKKY